MRKPIQLILAYGIAISMTGCATPYMTDRGRDAADILTATVGVGGGAKARVGPVRGGLFLGLDRSGLRGGEFITDMVGMGSHGVGGLVPGTLDADFTISSLECYFPAGSTTAEARGKLLIAGGALGLSASLWSDESGDEWSHKPWPQHLHYYTQLEVAAGLGGTLRLGFNPGELLDFLIGWTTLDIFSDDLTKRQSNKALLSDAVNRARERYSFALEYGTDEVWGRSVNDEVWGRSGATKCELRSVRTSSPGFVALIVGYALLRRPAGAGTIRVWPAWRAPANTASHPIAAGAAQGERQRWQMREKGMAGGNRDPYASTGAGNDRLTRTDDAYG